MTDQAARPEVKGGAVPYLALEGAVKATEFYQRAFGATVAMLMPPDDQGRTMHAHVYINGSSVMLGDCYPEHGHPFKEPQGFNIMLPVEDVDTWFKRAVEAGCTELMAPADMFWGDRYAQVRDPFGITWAFNAPTR